MCRLAKNEHECTPETTCRQCCEWGKPQWDKFQGKGTYAARKRLQKTPPVSSSPGSSVVGTVSKKKTAVKTSVPPVVDPSGFPATGSAAWLFLPPAFACR